MGSPKRQLKFTIPGLYHPIDIYLVSRRYIHSKFRADGGSIGKGETVNGYYTAEENKIFICYELARERRSHTLFHEIVHHIEEEASELGEEDRCDIVGAYILNLMNNEDFREVLRKIESHIGKVTR